MDRQTPSHNQFRLLSVSLPANSLHVDFVFHDLQILIAFSPLLALAYVLFTAFESEEAENLKRKKKSDFELQGHAE
jgi:hypothetical protein